MNANQISDENARLRKENERLRSALEGCLHFDDGFIRHDTIGAALRQWRAEAEALLATSTTEPFHQP
jgi:hypothetical protein